MGVPLAGRAFVNQALSCAKSWPFRASIPNFFGSELVFFVEVFVSEKVVVDVYSVRSLSFDELLLAERSELVATELAKRLASELMALSAKYSLVFGDEASLRFQQDLNS